MSFLKNITAPSQAVVRSVSLLLAVFAVSTMVNSTEKPDITTNSVDTPCRVTMESIHWDASDYHSRLCLRINSERSCFPKERLAFDNRGGEYDSSFWIGCAVDYRYGFEWELFKDTGNGFMGLGRGAGSQVFHTKNGDTNHHSLPYFPQIRFTITPYSVQP